MPQVFAIAVQEVESVEPKLSPAQVFESRLAMAVECNDLAIEDCRPGTQFSRQASRHRPINEDERKPSEFYFSMTVSLQGF